MERLVWHNQTTSGKGDIYAAVEADQVARVRADRDDGAEFAQRLAEATRRLGVMWQCCGTIGTSSSECQQLDSIMKIMKIMKIMIDE